MNECTYVKPWIGECGNKTDSHSENYCEEHMDKTCRCGQKATHGCSITRGALVCGCPLCDDEDCKSEHINKVHSLN